MSRVLAASAFIAKMCRGEAAVTRRPGWSNTRRLPGSSLPGLLVEPPRWQPEFLRNVSCFFQDDTVGHEKRVDIASHAGGIIGEGHRGSADDEHVGDYAPAHQAVPESSERSFELCPVE